MLAEQRGGDSRFMSAAHMLEEAWSWWVGPAQLHSRGGACVAGQVV